MTRVAAWANFIKLEHTFFSLPLIVSGILLHVRGWPTASLLLLILLAAVSGRIVAMGLNRIIDAEIDARNPRTQRRELPRGAMQTWEAWLIVTIAWSVYVISAARIAPICLWLSPVPVVLFVIYPYLKRFTSLSHLGLGLAWSMGPLGGWLAASKSLSGLQEVAWLWLFSVAWVAGFDVIYATMDEAFDRQEKLHALPARVGRQRALQAARWLHAAAFIALAMLWRQELYSPIALRWLVGVGALLVWEHMIADRKPAFAFFQLNGIIGCCVLGMVLAGMR